MRVAIQGVRGAFHHEAAEEYFGEAAHFVECPTFDELCATLEDRKADYGVMATQNTIVGRIMPNEKLIESYQFKTIGEITLKVVMNLMALPNQGIGAIESLHSHAIALRQCSSFLAQYPHWKLIKASNTAHAAKIISEKRINGSAAIASEKAGEIYELEILKKNIQDCEQNYTRFLVIERHS
jgi:prephenate dehydratase